MAQLYDRYWRVRVDTLDVSQLDVQFTIEKSLKPEPNSCSLIVTNLSPDHRKQIEEMSLYDAKPTKRSGTKAAKVPKTGNIRVEIEAGYKDAHDLIFRGDLRRGISALENGTWTTEIEGEDGGQTYLASRVNLSFPPGTPRYTVVLACASAMGLGVGNVLTVADRLQAVYANGTTLSGQASVELKGILRRAGVRYSIQNGELRFENVVAGREIPAVLLSPETGLVGTPARDATGGVEFIALIQPGLSPGAFVALASKEIKGVFQIQRVRYEGNTQTSDWYAHCEAAAR